jgi:hypothetical protein
MKDLICFVHIYFGITLLCFSKWLEISVNGLVFLFGEFGSYHCLAYSIIATCFCCSLNPFVLARKGRQNVLVTMVLASTILGMAASVRYVQSHHGAWKTRENIETGRFYTPGMFVFPDYGSAEISYDLKSKEEIKYAEDVLYLSKLYFWRACLDFAPPFLLASWLYGMFIFALTQKKFFRSQPRITAKA